MKDIFENSSSFNILTPIEIKNLVCADNDIIVKVNKYSKTISDIITKKDKRKIIICGPCSMHDPISIFEYARKLAQLSHKVKKHILLVLRVYLEKPRTILGWKGFINDPNLDDSCEIQNSLKICRKLLIKLLQLDIPLCTELLDLNMHHYFGDLFSWYAIGARNSESQLHRELVSSISTPVGYKNSTDGTHQSAVFSIISSNKNHTFLGINNLGTISILKSKGNNNTHLILRGGKKGPNYSLNIIEKILKDIKSFNVNNTILIDCSHDNANKNFEKQILVFNDILKYLPNENIIGMMLESNIYEGNQKIDNCSKYGVSITDSCISWKNTEVLINNLSKILKTNIHEKDKINEDQKSNIN